MFKSPYIYGDSLSRSRCKTFKNIFSNKMMDKFEKYSKKLYNCKQVKSFNNVRNLVKNFSKRTKYKHVYSGYEMSLIIIEYLHYTKTYENMCDPQVSHDLEILMNDLMDELTIEFLETIGEQCILMNKYESVNDLFNVETPTLDFWCKVLYNVSQSF